MCLQIFWTFYTILYVKTTKSKYIDHQSEKEKYDSMTQVIFGSMQNHSTIQATSNH